MCGGLLSTFRPGPADIMLGSRRSAIAPKATENGFPDALYWPRFAWLSAFAFDLPSAVPPEDA